MRRFIRKLIQNRVNKIILLSLVCSLVVAHIVLLVHMGRVMTSTEPENYGTQVENVLNLVMQIQNNTQTEKWQNLLSVINVSYFEISNNEQVKLTINKQPQNTLQFLAHQDVHSVADTINKDSTVKNFSYQLKNGEWLNYVTIPTETDAKLLFLLTLLIVIELFMLGMFIGYIWLTARFTMPLQRFKQNADQLGINIDLAPMKGYAPAVVREAVDAINKLQKRLQELLQRRTRMLAAISHDLRTPITRLKLQAQFIDDKHAIKIVKNLDEMDMMIDAILSYAKEETLNKPKQKFDINSLIASVSYDYADMGYLVEYSCDHGVVPFWGHPLVIKRLFTNIIGNAVKHAEHVWVHLQHGKDTIIVTVEDNGSGIPDAELKKVFQAFYQTENNPIDTGIGLGLSIVHEIIHKQYGGTIDLQNISGKGLRVTVVLPNQSS